MKRGVWLFLVLTVFCISSVFAQDSFSISGSVYNSTDKKPLLGANVLIKSKILGGNFKGTVSDDKGNFSFSGLAPGRYTLIFSFVGFISDTLKTFIKDADVKLPLLYLKEDVALLKEFEVQSVQSRMEIKGDTVEHKADAYKTNPDASAEDLVKKMPGVTSEGNVVKVNGEEVKKVLVDGKPFFSDDPTATLRNLPADIVDNVQMFDFQSEQSQFTGFRDGNEERTINLNTRKGMNVGQFGKIYAGYGPDNKYNAGLTISSFNGAQRISIIGMTNNVNQQNFNIADIMSMMSNSSSQGGGRPSRRGGGDFRIGQQNGITNTDALGLNYNDNWGKKVKVSASYFYNKTNNTDSSDITRDYFTDDALRYNETGNTNTINYNHRFNGKFEYVIDSLNKLTLTPVFTYQENNKESFENGVNSLPLTGEMVNETGSRTKAVNKGYNFSNDALLQHKFRKKGRTISLNINTQVSNRKGDGSYYASSLYSDTTNTDSIVDRQYTTLSNSKTLGGNLSYTEPMGSKMQWLITYRPSVKESVAEKNTTDVDSAGFYTIADSLLSNTYKNTVLSHRGGLSWGLNTAAINFNIGSDIEYAVLDGNQSFPYILNTRRTFRNVLPSAMFNFKYGKNLNLNAQYRSSSRMPDVSQLQNVADVSNPLFVKTGNPYLRQSFENRLTIRLSKRLPEKEKHFMLFLMANKTDAYITNATTILNNDSTVMGVHIGKGAQITMPVNLNNYYNMRLFGVYGFPLSKIKSNLNLNAGYNLTQTPGLINNMQNLALNNAFNAGLYLSSNISEKLDFSVSYNGSCNLLKNTLQSQSDNTYFTHTASLKANAIVFNNFVLNSDISQSYYTGLSDTYNQSFTLWNAYIGYKIQKKQNLEIKVSVYDILNQNTSISRNITELYTEDTRTNVLTRYALLTLTYTFKNFKNGATGPQEFKPPKGFPPLGNMPPPPPPPSQ